MPGRPALRPQLCFHHLRKLQVTGRVDAASDLAYRTFTNPVVKALAVGTGTKRAVQRLKGDPSPRRRDRRAS